MARIRPLKVEEVLPENRGRFESNQAKFGTVLNSTGVYAYCPPILNGGYSVCCRTGRVRPTYSPASLSAQYQGSGHGRLCLLNGHQR